MIRHILLTLIIMLGGANIWAFEKETFKELKTKTCHELNSSKNNSSWYQASSPKAVVVIVHGLNNKPEIMGDDLTPGTLVSSLLKEHYSVLRVQLYGHGKDLKEMENTQKDLWLSSAYQQFCWAYEKKKELPIILVGFSLGALVFEELMNEKTATPVIFNKAILFAPAVSISTISRGIGWLNFFKKGSTNIPSVAPKEYRAHSGTSLNAYKALFELEDDLERSKFENNNIPTLTFINPNDEVVDYEKLKRTIEKFRLKRWRLIEVSTKEAKINPKYHHLIIDQRALGEKEWLRVNDEMMKFIKAI